MGDIGLEWGYWVMEGVRVGVLDRKVWEWGYWIGRCGSGGIG